MSKIKKTYTEEFKQQAVNLALESGKPKAQIARDLGISDSMLYGWIDLYQKANGSGKTVLELAEENKEIKRLKSELRQVQMENDLLKKAAEYFAKNQL
jgi:transposase